MPYRVQRVEEHLGVYDAPALKIRPNTESADILPIGRFTPLPLSIQNWLFISNNRETHGSLSDGRVDITDGERRRFLLRSHENGEDRWYAQQRDQAVPVPLNRARLEEILKDLLA